MDDSYGSGWLCARFGVACCVSHFREILKDGACERRGTAGQADGGDDEGAAREKKKSYTDERKNYRCDKGSDVGRTENNPPRLEVGRKAENNQIERTLLGVEKQQKNWVGREKKQKQSKTRKRTFRLVEKQNRLICKTSRLGL